MRQVRFQAQVLLDEATYEQRGRFGELLLMLPPLQSVAWQMVETLQLARLLGEASVDSLLQEMLLGEEAAGARGGPGASTGAGAGAGPGVHAQPKGPGPGTALLHTHSLTLTQAPTTQSNSPVLSRLKCENVCSAWPRHILQYH